MKVVFAGYSKCGTKSMAAAFRELGLKVYDFMEQYEECGDQFKEICLKGGTKEDFQKMLKDVDAVTDVPAYFFWEEILEAFPEAKVIFCQRETEDDWFKSWEKQLLSGDKFSDKLFGRLSPSYWIFRDYVQAVSVCVFGLRLNDGLFKKVTCNELRMRMAYRRHNNYILQKAPKDKLLVWKLGDGWKPICEFLNIPVPNKPFPHLNKNASLWDDIRFLNPTLRRIGIESLISLSFIFCGVSYGVYKMHNRVGWKWVLNVPNNFIQLFK